MSKRSARELIEGLSGISRRFGGDATRTKRDLLSAVRPLDVRSAPLLRRLHDTLLFIRAYPDTPEIYDEAGAGLAEFSQRVQAVPEHTRERLADTGISGASVAYEYSFATLSQLERAYPGRFTIAWDVWAGTEKLEEMLARLICPAEVSGFEDGQYSTPEWLTLAAGGEPSTELPWLLRALNEEIADPVEREALFDAAELPAIWDLGHADAARTLGRIEAGEIFCHPKGLKRLRSGVKREVVRPMPRVRRVTGREADTLILNALTALAVRRREVHATTYANREEVYLADAGRGVVVLILGVLPEQRLGLEGNYGYVVYKNGLPVGYGGASPLFYQANTGVNLFEEYRGGESANLFVQTLRAFHALFDCTQFIASPYQFGGGNLEAINSGAFWFYYKLGFRPANRRVADLAREEDRKRRADPRYRSDRPVLRDLAGTDMHLMLPGGKASQRFEESYLAGISESVTAHLGAQGTVSRRAARKRVLRRVCDQLASGTPIEGSGGARTARESVGLVLSLLPELATWPVRERRALAALVRSKGDPQERAYVKRLRASDALRKALSRVGRTS